MKTDGGRDGATDSTGSNTPDAPFANVDGTVLDVFGQPMSGANVRIGTAVMTTGGDGQFHFTAVPPTYDLDVVTTESGGLKRLTGYRGLTTRAPQVQVSAFALQMTSVSGSFSGVTFPLGTNQHIMLADTEEYFGFDQPTLPGGDDVKATTFSGATAVWFGKTTFQGTIWAIEYTGTSTQAITAYNGYARIPLSLTAGTPGTVNGISLTPLSTSTLSGTVSSIPAGAGSASVSVALKHAADPFGHFVGGSTSTTGAFSLAAPNATGSISVNVVAQAGTSSAGVSTSYTIWKANVPSNTTNVALAFPTAPSYGSPVNGATAVAGNETFTWSAGTPAGVYMLDISCGSAAPNYAATIFTAGTSVQMPDTSALGATWPGTESCTWKINFYSEAANVDAVTAANARNKLDRYNGPVDGSLTQVSGFSFTTQ